jgi:hypothetical protein
VFTAALRGKFVIPRVLLGSLYGLQIAWIWVPAFVISADGNARSNEQTLLAFIDPHDLVRIAFAVENGVLMLTDRSKISALWSFVRVVILHQRRMLRLFRHQQPDINNDSISVVLQLPSPTHFIPNAE